MPHRSIDVASLPDPVLEPKIKAAFDTAYANITKFHRAQVCLRIPRGAVLFLPRQPPCAWKLPLQNPPHLALSPQVREPIVMETMPGITCRRVCRPIERVGIYVRNHPPRAFKCCLAKTAASSCAGGCACLLRCQEGRLCCRRRR